jgi:hypothetical protein
MSECEFSVVEFYSNDTYAYVERWLDAESAVKPRLLKLINNSIGWAPVP